MPFKEFGLKEPAFGIEPDLRFLALSESQREAMATLLYAVEHNEGWALVTGPSGCGKTILLQALAQDLGAEIHLALVNYPRMEVLDLFNLIAADLGLSGPFGGKGDFVVHLRRLIEGTRQKAGKVLLIIDEAHELSLEALEELRLLANLDGSSPKTLYIFLVGQPELSQHLEDPRLRNLKDRIRRRSALESLGEMETMAYIRHRLKVAGGDPDIFEHAALADVYRFSKGVPRRINSLCDAALQKALEHQKQSVGVAEVAAAQGFGLGPLPGPHQTGAPAIDVPLLQADDLPAAQELLPTAQFRSLEEPRTPEPRVRSSASPAYSGDGPMVDTMPGDQVPPPQPRLMLPDEPEKSRRGSLLRRILILAGVLLLVLLMIYFFKGSADPQPIRGKILPPASSWVLPSSPANA